MFGRLTLADFIQPGPVATGGQLVVVMGVIGVLLFITLTKRWGWLWREYLTSLDHKKIGIMYLVLGGLMGARGFIDALMLRGQQATATTAAGGYLSPDHFAQVFTAHGVIMIFFMAMSVLFGIINLIIPLQIGARDVAFPFLNSVSFYLTAAGAVLINLSLVLGSFAATGWLAYPPLSELQYSPGVGVDYYIWALQIAGIGTLLSGINFITTIATLRAPGMKLMRMPLFVWTTLGAMFLVIFAFPVLTVTLTLLALDRTLMMHFFTTNLGGNQMMFVNLIWAWGHPEVYILILPAFGIFSEIVATFSHKRLFGYTSMVVATMLITLLSFMVWVHHFFTMGAGADVNAFFGIMTMIIAIPTGVKVFNWLFTMFRGRIVFATPMLWFMGFLVTFVIGGSTGVLMSIPAADFELHNSLFLVAHFHNMIIGGVLFGFFAGFSYWFPKFSGFTLSERIGRYAFWLWITGFLLAFMPLYALGIMGATRRLQYIDPSSGYNWLFYVAAIGAVVIACALLTQIFQVLYSVKHREAFATGSDPWDARTLEWALPTPVPEYNFATIPHVKGRDPFWEMKKHAQRLPWPEDAFEMPRNSALGMVFGACGFIFGFGMIWHMWWLPVIAVVGVIASIIVRSFASDTELSIDPTV